ncbi:MAG: efflux RND transporter periplasmic adaptor subunit [Verrucomicrobiota bacterium]
MADSGYANQEGFTSVSQLKKFSGPPTEFWPLFLKCACENTGASRAALAAKAALRPSDAPVWRQLSAYPKGGASLPESKLLSLAAAEGIARSGKDFAFAVGSEEIGEGVVWLEFSESNWPEDAVSATASLLGLLPEAWRLNRNARALDERLKRLTEALDLNLVVGAQKRFAEAVFAVCNELAGLFDCERVILGWQDDEALRLKGMSQADKFDARSHIIRQVEAAMEETFDQNQTLVYPAIEGESVIVREHEAYAKEASVSHMCSLPLRSGTEVCGVLLLERGQKGFSEEELRQLRVMADQIGQRLKDLRSQDMAFPLRLWLGLKEKCKGFLGPRHTGAKLAGVGAALVVLFLILGRLPYSVEAPATLRSDQVVYATAPFDGFIDEVFFKVGDSIQEGDRLATFDTREILAQQAAEIANRDRFAKEMERARANNALADMRVAEAQLEQANAVLEKTLYRLEQSVITASVDGVIVEGDLRKRLGAPVRQGEALFQQARLDSIYVQVEVAEKDVHEILDAEEARMLFAAQPDTAFPLLIEKLQPVGMQTPSGIVFRLRANSQEAAPDWWRPGMSGTVRIDVGWRNVGWILTHRTTDWLRRQLWW